MMPVPTMPTVLPCRSKPSSPCSEKSPSRARDRARQAPVQREYQADRVLRNRVRRVGRHAHDRDARPRSRRQIDVIEARRAQCNEPRAARVQTFDRGGIDVIVDERTHDFVAIREDGRFGVEIRFLEVQLVAEGGVGFVERVDVVLTAAEQDHAHELLPIPRARAAGEEAIASIAAAAMAKTTEVVTAMTPLR
jgi:hypothetical protein